MTYHRAKGAAKYAAVGAQAFLLLLAALSAGPVAAAEPVPAGHPPSVAFLGVRFMNDNASLEPTTDARRANRSAGAAVAKWLPANSSAPSKLHG